MVDTPPPVSGSTSATLATAAVTPDEIALITAAIQNIPDKLAQLARQIQLSGLITSIAPDNSFTVQTAAGDITLNLAPQPNGSPNPLTTTLPFLVQNQRPLTIFVSPGDPPALAQIAISQSLLLNATLHASQTQKLLGEDTTKTSAPFVIGQKLSTVVLPTGNNLNFSGDKPISGDPAIHALNSNSLLGNTLGSLKTFATPILNQLRPILEESKIGTEKTSPLFQPNTLNATTFRQGAALDFRIASINSPNSPPLMTENKNQIVATVMGKAPGGQLILHAEGSTLFVRTQGDLPVGTRLMLDFVPQTAADVTFPDNPYHSAQALQQFMAALAQIDPQAAQQLLQTRIPQPNLALPATLLFLFNAFQQGGNAGNWVGEAALSRLDKAGKRELITKLIEEMQRSGGEVHDSAVGAWRSYPMPMHHQNMYQMMHLYVHQDAHQQKQGTGGGNAPSKTRFLINLNMTRLGALQMDGLTQKKKLDMVIRSERPLPESLPQELRTLYLQTLEAVGLTGSINFQSGRQSWVVVQQSANKAGVVT